jgi:glycosyltransferase involved in cell wall biosynthesis
MSSKKRNILVYESEVTGHHVEFLVNIIKTAPINKSRHLFLLVKRETIPRLKAHLQKGIKVTLLEIENFDFNFFNRSSLLQLSSFNEIRVLEVICKQHSVDRLMLMSMNKYQLALAMLIRKGDIQVRGIMFNPFIPLHRSSGFWRKLYLLAHNTRKILQYACMFNNQNIDRVFLLNDALSVNLLNQIFSRKRLFKLLVDPLPYEVQKLNKRIPGAPKADTSFTFLMFGVMTPRKGVLEVLKAIKSGGETFQKKIVLRIVGEFSKKFPEWHSKVLLEVDWINDHLDSINVDVVDKFVSFSELYGFLKDANCVLAPYINHSGSSGVIGHACVMERPIVVASGGLMADIVNEYRIGEIADACDSNSLITILKDIVGGNTKYNIEGARTYANMANYSRFGETLFGGWYE